MHTRTQRWFRGFMPWLLARGLPSGVAADIRKNRGDFDHPGMNRWVGMPLEIQEACAATNGPRIVTGKSISSTP